MADPVSTTEPSIDRSIFIPSLLVVLAISLSFIVFPETAGPFAQEAQAWVTTNFGWLFLFSGVAMLVFSLWMAFGPYGHVKLGDPDEKPEYSNYHWIAMMFTAGIGGGLIVWGFAEPIYYLQTPPFGIEPHSNEAFEWAHMYPLFHWGLTPWSMYVVPAIPIAYMLYVRKEPIMRVSSTCDGALPNTGRGIIKTLIDVLIVFGIVGGTATALGLGIPLVSAFLAEFLGVEDSRWVRLGLLAVWTILFGASVYRGLKRGIKILADINMALAILAIIFVFAVGPSLYILKMSSNSVGLMFDNFMMMSFWTDPIEKSGFPEAWTVFYWTWWLAFAAFVGLFIARISRGRTIRQVTLGVMFWGTLGTWIFLSVVGGYALNLEASGAMAVSDIMTSDGQFTLVAKILASMPLGKLVLAVFIVLAVIFYATNIDSAAFVLASVCSKNLRGDQEPGRNHRLLWAVVLGILTAGLVVTNQLDAIKAASIVTALPLVPVIFLMCISFVKWMREDQA